MSRSAGAARSVGRRSVVVKNVPSRSHPAILVIVLFIGLESRNSEGGVLRAYHDDTLAAVSS